MRQPGCSRTPVISVTSFPLSFPRRRGHIASLWSLPRQSVCAQWGPGTFRTTEIKKQSLIFYRWEMRGILLLFSSGLYNKRSYLSFEILIFFFSFFFSMWDLSSQTMDSVNWHTLPSLKCRGLALDHWWSPELFFVHLPTHEIIGGPYTAHRSIQFRSFFFLSFPIIQENRNSVSIPSEFLGFCQLFIHKYLLSFCSKKSGWSEKYSDEK